jgi:hypothetical protein
MPSPNQLNKRIDLHSLPKYKARMEIAKDVIAAINAKKLSATHNGYLEIRNIPKRDPGSFELRSLLPDIPPCQVCAVGACFVAAVARVNKLEVDVIPSYTYSDDSRVVTPDTDKMMDVLGEWFSPKQLGMIECAFEQFQQPQCSDVVLSPAESRKAYHFAERAGFRYLRDTRDAPALLLTIMENVISNKGTFKP